MTAFETGRYDMFKRVCTFGETHRGDFAEGSDATKTFALVAKAIADIDGFGSAKRDVRQHGWRKRNEARKALAGRLKELANVAKDEGRRVPGADERFPLPRKRWDLALLQHGRLFVEECANARGMFLRFGMPETFVDDLKALVQAFERSMHQGSDRKTTIFVARCGIGLSFAQGFEAVRTLDVIVNNSLRQEPTLLALWKDIRRNDSRRKSKSTLAA